MSTEIENKGGRPVRGPIDPAGRIERAAVIKTQECLDDIIHEIAALRRLRGAGTLSNADVGSAKVIIYARLKLLDKKLPDLRTSEITGAVDHRHAHIHAKVSNIDIATRLQHWRLANDIVSAEDESKVMVNTFMAAVDEVLDIEPVESGPIKVINPEPESLWVDYDFL